MYIIASGNVVDGLAHWGPFESSEDALKWAQCNVADDWNVIALEFPGEDETPTRPVVEVPDDVAARTRSDIDACSQAPDGLHEPDAGTFTAYDTDGGTYLDVTCRHCGRSGCAGRFDLESPIQW